MHPVLLREIDEIAARVAPLSLDEAQVHPLPGQGRWSAQDVVEHLLLSFEMTVDVVGRQLEKGKPPRNRRSLLESCLRLQTLGFGLMPDGIPTMLRLRPGRMQAQDGQALAKQLLAAAEEMDAVLTAARRKFGIQACGEHPFYGVLRVDEWRRYHAVHARHHLPQIQKVIGYVARLEREGEALTTGATPGAAGAAGITGVSGVERA